ncbi:TPA: hypothetical protein ACPZPQ_004258, partial [Yersinia enterocolitica]
KAWGFCYVGNTKNDRNSFLRGVWRGFLCVKSHIKEKATLAGGLFCFTVLRRPEHDIRQVG